MVNNWDIYDSWVREFITALRKHAPDLLMFNGQDATHYRIGRNATVRFAPNLYPVIANIVLPAPRNLPDTATATQQYFSNISYES